MSNVYIVQNVYAGDVYAIFISENDAKFFAEIMGDDFKVVERTLYYGQPPQRGFNK